MKPMLFNLAALMLLVAQTQAKWCCCRGEDAGTINCCYRIEGRDTFYSLGCGLIDGQTCDLGPDGWKQERFKDCCFLENGRHGKCF
jgi:hypothetical protein